MADVADVEPEVVEQRKTRKPANTGDGEKDEVQKAADESSSHGSKNENLAAGESEADKKKPSKFKELWGKLGFPGVIEKFEGVWADEEIRGSVAPTIGIAFYEANSVADIYSTLGYLVAIISVLAMPIMPRAKYFQTLILNVIGICVGSAVALLGIWSGVQARLHTSASGSTESYNSSQAAVCAIWLFANIWFANTLRAKVPALQFPVIMYSIFTNVAFTYGPLFPNIAAGESLIKRLLEGFLTAFALATAVNLFIIPVTSRKVVFKEQAGYIGLIRGTLKAQKAYLTSLETSDMFATGPGDSDASKGDAEGKKKKAKKNSKKDSSHPAHNTQAKALKGSLDALLGLHGKLHGDMPFAKREIAWGKLNQKDLDEIFRLFRSILIPLIGMGTITDIFARIAERRGWVDVPDSKYHEAEKWEECSAQEKEKEKETWNAIMKTLHEPFEVVVQAMDEGLEHTSIALELAPKPKAKKGEDVEAKGGDNPKPGDTDFAKYLEQKMVEFYNKRGETLKAWARLKGLSEGQFDAAHTPGPDEDFTPDEAQHRRDQQQLYLILYLEHLLYSCGIAILNLIKFADQKVADGTMNKNRLIAPGQRRLKKWIMNIGQEDATVDTESPDSLEAGMNTIYLGSGFNPKKDPEHLPPATAWQHFGNAIRTIPHFLGSQESAFGFRVACATLTIGIVAFLKDTQTFFIEQRLAIGMTMTSGQSLFGFFGRVAGTAISMVLAIVCWYIVNQHTAGIIVFLWLFIFLEMYFFLKFPRFIPVFLVSIVTLVLIIGYELQVRVIGLAASESSGQPYYPIYELAPYRLACVAGGSFVAFVWTIFPYPLSDKGWLRRDLGSTLYLLANFYSVVHSTIGARMHDREGDMNLKSSPGKSLEKSRHKIFGKLLLLIPSLKQHADWQKWEPTIGGKFPRETYEGITLRAMNIMNYLSLMSYATESWTKENGAVYTNTEPKHRREWLNDLMTLVDSIGPTSHSITSILSLLSASVKTGSALPPYIQMPEPYDLSRRLERLDKGILDARHVEEPGYSAYAVLQVCSSLVTDDLRRLVDHVRELVGETDFSFQVKLSETSLDSTGSESSGKGKRD
ncbi:uncharacterized protein PAC_07136 [Phialocephala subalpina]|uniref:ER transporter 6TM N-terminal domain-containing protein n=1 Tax=Phialocephala subalpina TaxID=576137 RepID=A0A1L7WWV4_9HELO|nr:uncharacterized protein PAC_07136 [Phialocephala subalpina]